MVKIAVIYTGAVRTIETTIDLFKKNVLENDNYHVFAVLQAENKDFYENLIKNAIGENLKSLLWFNNSEEWLNLRDELISTMNINDSWKNYLKTSGSMIEYYQMYLSYKNIEIYEKENNIKYDFVLRFRTDTVLKDKIIFNYDMYDYDYAKNLLYQIKNNFNCENIIDYNVLCYFMNSFFSTTRVNYELNSENCLTFLTRKRLLELTDETQFINELVDYIKNGKYLIGLRVNVIYFIKRELMSDIYILGISYGKYIMSNNNYWFNAESQLKEICIINGIDFFSSVNELEGSSLYNYNKSNYYDIDNNLKDDKYSFFIKRN